MPDCLFELGYCSRSCYAIELIGAQLAQQGMHAVLFIEAIDVVANGSGRVFVAFIWLSADLL